ncbi:hypothetical protein NQ318_015385 [Aromia moschata]|uniref:Tc1-like transposase DDE domain-containing protein n=1 Tax=Aromia moschata TaxID=1265417 RepID=A0AAV8YPY4_9CUCU|nr:hypothetical protein NQ318_015385 [Aromia moschata]
MFRPWENSKPSTNIHDDEENLNRTDDLLQEQGKKNYLCEKAQQIVMNVYRNTVASEGEKGAIEKTSFLTDVPLSTLARLIKTGPKKRKTRSDKGVEKKLDTTTVKLLRDTIYEKYKKNEIATVESIHTDLRGNGFINVSQETVRKWILKIGFKFKVIDKRANVMESRRIVEWRMEYLENIKRYRAENRPIYYLDETWYDTHDTPRKGWTDGSKKCIVDLPSNKGTRLIILHCGSENGWVNNCLKLCGKKLEDSNVDYHRNMTSEIFEELFKEILIPNLERNSVIVLDNASYHSKQIEKIPNKSSKKADIQKFLNSHGVQYDKKDKKEQLLDLVKKSNFKKRYVIDELAKDHGHTVLRLPPYYCIFNPIELIWSQLKRAVRRNNTFPKFDKKVIDLIRTEVDKITPEKWKKMYGESH